MIQAYDKADYEFCGKESPHDVVSDGPRLVLVFSSGETVGSGFKGRYQFETGKVLKMLVSCHFMSQRYQQTNQCKRYFMFNFQSTVYPARQHQTAHATLRTIVQAV